MKKLRTIAAGMLLLAWIGAGPLPDLLLPAEAG
jgi:hypothetical protein